ncbi:uncharacterized protein N0V89_011998 [Didymosphaeria variabile]|uniref:Yippee domain-containing protein n=1 Tax=Didymosphaeria variabile TaxID=1932322 RepID=A0A9W8XBL2_9PLEO|nr:uncharacterized protein N0V89_011998 [Didymosphaeria variabile]KAJ4345863.1 hypothetical protein N0V89_011998 [Didymosphaeria variabile]
MTEIAESREASPPRATTGVCRKCGATAGELFNAWHKITTSYFLPAQVGAYRSRLRRTGLLKKASIGTELNGCTVIPLNCQRCDTTLGISIVDAPHEKLAFRGRDLFKLSKIELRCQVARDEFLPVEPQVQLPDSLPVVVQDSPNPATTQPPTMEVDSRPHPPLPGPRHMHYDQHHDQHHRRSFEATRQSLPPPQTARSPPAPLPLHGLPHKSPSNPPLASPSPAVKPVLHDVQYSSPHLKQSPRESSVASRLSSSAPQSHPHSPVDQRLNGQVYPRPPQDVQLDAIERLQTQTSQNSSALVAQTRDMRQYEQTLQHEGENLRREFTTHFHQQNAEIRRVDEAVGRLQHEMLGIRELLEGLSREVHATRELQTRASIPGGGLTLSGQDTALELMAQQMAVMNHKTNEVETLKITIEIMKNKIQRLEDASAAPPAQVPSSQYASPREASVRPVQPPLTAPYRALPTQVPQIDIPVPSGQRTLSYPSQGSQSVAVTPDASQRPEPAQSQPGWATVNAGIKRSHANGTDSPRDSIGPSLASPGKRPKLAAIEPRGPHAGAAYPYEHADTDDSDAARMQTHRHTLPSQSIPASSVPPSTLASQHHFVPYGTQDGPSDESWRPESQRAMTEVRTPGRGRGRGGGPGSRGGRVRKSMAAQYAHPLSTPEWEREEWHGIPESQVSPDGYYSARSGRGIVRRGSGGSGRGGHPGSSGRSVSLGLQGVTAGAGIGSPDDPYAHTKKTRTKPIRNADGVLIRKDGRPDMRSQSSAANLRKVHARKEEEERLGLTPTPSKLSTSVRDTATPSPTEYSSGGHDPTASQKKHNELMSKIFPSGIDEVRKDHDYARKLFDEDTDHTAQPRTAQHQHHHHHRSSESHAAPFGIKREHAEEQPHDEDVDMDRDGDHADDEGQTPGGQSDGSGQGSQYHDAAEREAHQPHQKAPREDPATVPQATGESSQTLAAGSHRVEATGSTVA